MTMFVNRPIKPWRLIMVVLTSILMVAGSTVTARVLAQPDAAGAESVTNLTVYPDRVEADRFYYAAGQVEPSAPSAMQAVLRPAPITSSTGSYEQIEFALRMRELPSDTIQVVRTSLRELHGQAARLDRLPMWALAGKLIVPGPTDQAEPIVSPLPDALLVDEHWLNDEWVERRYRIELDRSQAATVNHALERTDRIGLRLRWASLPQGPSIDLPLTCPLRNQRVSVLDLATAQGRFSLADLGPINHVFPDRR
jgi:hypothetical protein